MMNFIKERVAPLVLAYGLLIIGAALAGVAFNVFLTFAGF